MMKRVLYLIIAVSSLMSSCKKTENTAESVDQNSVIKKGSIDRQTDSIIDAFFNSLPDEIEIDYNSGTEIHKMHDGSKKSYRIKDESPNVGTTLNKKAGYGSTEIGLLPDNDPKPPSIYGAKIRLMANYTRETDSYYQSEYIKNPLDIFDGYKVTRSFMQVTRWVDRSKSMAHWRGLVNYVITYGYRNVRTKQVRWSGSVFVPRD
ncbi:hypothetical protein [Chryseobacterium camelliae]|uniref:hypothetical protein n=1 Tax=Chryseobacterium camelliae TaxID=1265445 RepID=UPI001AE2A875|nr:hypothetical protein [Chryseobacterium camelliae]MDR6513733.1 hypothetical protein [Chryseobacterium camelliae]